MYVCKECAERGEIIGRFGGKKREVRRRKEEDLEIFDIVDDYPQRISEAMKKMGVGVEELARRAKMSPETMKKILGGHIKPTLEEARKLERILKVRLIEEVVPEEGGEVKSGPALTLGDVVRLR